MSDSRDRALSAAVEAVIEEAARCAVPAFEANGWTYGGGLGSAGYTPGREHIAERLRELAADCLDEDEEIGCGRFSVRCVKRWYGKTLVFSLELGEVAVGAGDGDE